MRTASIYKANRRRSPQGSWKEHEWVSFIQSRIVSLQGFWVGSLHKKGVGVGAIRHKVYIVRFCFIFRYSAHPNAFRYFIKQDHPQSTIPRSSLIYNPSHLFISIFIYFIYLNHFNQIQTMNSNNNKDYISSSVRSMVLEDHTIGKFLSQVAELKVSEFVFFLFCKSIISPSFFFIINSLLNRSFMGTTTCTISQWETQVPLPTDNYSILSRI